MGPCTTQGRQHRLSREQVAQQARQLGRCQRNSTASTAGSGQTLFKASEITGDCEPQHMYTWAHLS